MPKVIAQSRPLALGRCHVTESIGCQSSLWDLQMVTIVALHHQAAAAASQLAEMMVRRLGSSGGSSATAMVASKTLRKTFGPSLSHSRPS